MQKAACGEDKPITDQLDRYPSACGEHAWSAIRHLQRLIPAARAAGVPVVYTKHIYRPHTGFAEADAAAHLSSLNPNSEIPVEIAPQDGDLLVEKQVASAFFHTGLIYMLLNLGVDSLLITGNSTSGCVRASAIDAAGYRFKVSVIEECVFDRLEVSHAVALFDLGFKYCDVVGVAEAEEQLARLGAARAS
jgi:nicotinamidase-related amidase